MLVGRYGDERDQLDPPILRFHETDLRPWLVEVVATA